MNGVPENIDNPDYPFNVDAILERLKRPRSRIRLHERWRGTPDRKMIENLRRCVEAAIHIAFDADEKLKYGEYAEDWTTAASMADRTSASLNALLRHLTGLGSKDLQLKGQAHLKTPLFSFRNAVEDDASVPQKSRMAEDDALALMRVNELLVRYVEFAKGKSSRLRTGRQHPGKPGKSAFVMTLAESWVWLTGRIPGKGADENPFLDFVAAAWKDAGEQEEDFVHSMRQAVDDLSNRIPSEKIEIFVPEWVG